MEILRFVLFLVVSQILLMQIYRFSTYHRYFPRALPFLVGFAALTAYMFFRLHLSNMFLWYPIGVMLLLWSNWRKNVRLSAAFDQTFAGDEQAMAVLKLSAASTRAYFMLSSVVYLVVFIVAFLYFFNVAARRAPVNSALQTGTLTSMVVL